MSSEWCNFQPKHACGAQNNNVTLLQPYSRVAASKISNRNWRDRIFPFTIQRLAPHKQDEPSGYFRSPSSSIQRHEREECAAATASLPGRELDSAAPRRSYSESQGASRTARPLLLTEGWFLRQPTSPCPPTKYDPLARPPTPDQ
ncbi:hypothetical protein C8R44DRAFT_725655 [Mycena epipterygia]|nr:hypothetical protein C8R44DRAFT_725655 [Mycena epipterygia]